MRLINRGSKQSPLARQACDIALAAHLQTYGDYGRSKMKETYTVKVEGVKVWVEVVNRKASFWVHKSVHKVAHSKLHAM
ncbi:DUF4060 family protein [Escherichia coli]|uniref:DUF4060 family protein n=1 Tax=Escherichia coli TaxID=562 RepID=UPI00135F3B1D|nr:DUF4060 family protein [Escherichia coli]MWG26176.1 DUF4060 family protein [Escherichia coli]